MYTTAAVILEMLGYVIKKNSSKYTYSPSTQKISLEADMKAIWKAIGEIAERCEV